MDKPVPKLELIAVLLSKAAFASIDSYRRISKIQTDKSYGVDTMSPIEHPVVILRRIAAKHREAAERFEAAADAAEAAYTAGYEADTAPSEATEALKPPPTTEEIAEYLASNSKRLPEIATYFGVDKATIRKILRTETALFYRGVQGWWHNMQ